MRHNASQREHGDALDDVFARGQVRQAEGGGVAQAAVIEAAHRRQRDVRAARGGCAGGVGASPRQADPGRAGIGRICKLWRGERATQRSSISRGRVRPVPTEGRNVLGVQRIRRRDDGVHEGPGGGVALQDTPRVHR